MQKEEKIKRLRERLSIEEVEDIAYMNRVREIDKDFISKIKEVALEIEEEEAIEIVNTYKRERWSVYREEDYGNEEKVVRSKDNKFVYIETENEDREFKFFGSDILEESFFVKVRVRDIDTYLMDEMIGKFEYVYNKEGLKERDKEDEELRISKLNSFIRVNPYRVLGKRYKEKGYIQYKDKEGKPIKLKRGYLYKCGKCNSYELVEDMTVNICFSNAKKRYKLESKVESNVDVMHIEYMKIEEVVCSVCKEKEHMNKIKFLHEKSNIRRIISKDIFNDLAEKGKIVIGNIELTRSFFGDKYSNKSESNKVVFNVETGRAYMLPTYDIDTKKKKGLLQQIGVSNINEVGSIIRIPLKYVCQVGLLMEEYMLKNDLVNKKALIPFKEYMKEYLLYIYKKENLDESLKNLESYIDSLFDNTSIEDDKQYKVSSNSSDTLLVLFFYNQNPYIKCKDALDIARIRRFHSYYGILGGKSFPTKAKNINRIRNTNLIKDLNEIIGIKSKLERKLINDSERKLSAYDYVYNLNATIKNQDNRNKFLNIEYEHVTKNKSNSLARIKVAPNPYLSKLIEVFGETTVTNALTKDIVKHNNRIKNEYGSNPLFFQISSVDDYNRRNDVWYKDTIRNYCDIVAVYPDYKLPCDRLRLKDLHDKIAKDASKIRNKEKVYTYEEKFMNMYDNKVIEDITFKVALSNHKLVEIGSQMGICVGGYWDRVEIGELFIVYMEREDEYIGCLEISKNGMLHQAKAKYNCKLNDKELELLKEYCLMTNIGIDTCDVADKYKVNRDSSKESVIYKNAIKITIGSKEDIEKILSEEIEETEENTEELDNDYDLQFAF